MTAAASMTAPDSGPVRAAGWSRWPARLGHFARRKPLGFFGLLVVLTLIVTAAPPFTGWIAPYNYNKQNLRHRYENSSPQHLLGTDQLGRDEFSRLVYGARVSVTVGFGAVALSTAIAVTLGILSGYYLGLFDRLFQRVVDIFQALPELVVLISVLGLFGSGLWSLVFVLGVLGGPGGSRLIRSQVIALKHLQYVEGAQVVGAGSVRVMLLHILPNIVPLLILTATLRLGAVVLAEATLSFLGYGLPPPFPSWGQMLTLDGREAMRTAPWLAIYPGLAIALTVYAFNVLGDALRDVFDPRLRQR